MSYTARYNLSKDIGASEIAKTVYNINLRKSIEVGKYVNSSYRSLAFAQGT